MFHPILILFSLVVFLLFLPLLAFLLRPGVTQLGSALQVIARTPLGIVRYGKSEAARRYRKKIPLTWAQFTLLSVALLSNVVVLVLGFFGVTAVTLSVLIGLFLAAASVSMMHLYMVRD